MVMHKRIGSRKSMRIGRRRNLSKKSCHVGRFISSWACKAQFWDSWRRRAARLCNRTGGYDSGTMK